MKKKIGKLNGVDIIIILLIVLVCGYFVYKYVSGKKQDALKEDVTITFCASQVHNYVIEKTKVGDFVLDGIAQINIGKVSDIVAVSDPSSGDYSSVKIAVVNKALNGNYGAIIDGKIYSVGQSHEIYAGYGFYNLVICDVEFSNDK